MPSLSVITKRPETSNTMRYVLSDGRQGSMYSTSKGFTYRDVQTNASIPREGRKDITRHTGPGLRELTFTQTIASGDYQRSIESVVRRFTNAGAGAVRIRFTGGSGSYEQPCWWIITGLDVTVVQRALNNEPSRVTLAWTLIEWVDVTVNIARLPPPPPAPARPVAKVQRIHRVAPGDTLWAIAGRYLGNSLRWPEVFNMNKDKIRNPNLIYAGQEFKIP